MNAPKKKAVSVTLHVGLPKTGTTALQRDAFPDFDGYVCGTESSGYSSILARQLEHLYDLSCDSGNSTTDSWEAKLHEWWVRATEYHVEPKLISLERLFRWRDPQTGLAWPFMGEGSAAWSQREGTHPLVKFLKSLTDTLDAVQFRVAFTIRNQPDFMASLYAQISKTLVYPGQQDFEEKVRRFLQSDDPFFHWSKTLSQIENLVGPENLAVFVYETGVDCVAQELADFLEISWSREHPIGYTKRKGDGDAWVIQRHNARIIRKALRILWPLDVAVKTRRKATPIVGQLVRKLPEVNSQFNGAIKLDSDWRRTILNHYVCENRELQRFTPHNLTHRGYSISPN